MPTRRILAVLALSSTLVPSVACRSKAKPKLTEQTFVLANGLEVELVAGPCGDRAAVVVLFEVGTDHDPAGASGLVHVIERALTTAERPVEVSGDHTVTSAMVSGDRLLDEVDGAAARMAKLELPAAELDRGRAEVLAELVKRHGGDAALTARSYAGESVQPTRGNGWRGGIAAEVEAIDRAEVEAFWQAHGKPGNARLIVVGRFDAVTVRRRIETAFANVPAGTPPVLRAAADSTVTGTLVMGDAPAAVAIAVPAPAPSAPLYPAFLILAARFPVDSYDPLTQPATLFVTGSVQPDEQPEAAAARLRAETVTLLARPLTPGDVAAARDRFGRFLGVDALEPAACKQDPRGFAIARARRGQLALDGAHLTQALEATTPAQLTEAAALFDPKRTAAVIAGGTIR